MIKDKIVVLTGTFLSMKRQDAAEALKAIGAKVSSSLSKKTDILFVGEKAGAKLKKAEALGIKIMNEEQLLEILEGKKIEVTTESIKNLSKQMLNKPANALLPYWSEIPYKIPIIKEKEEEFPPSRDALRELLRRRASQKPRGSLGISVGNSRYVYAWPNGIELYQERGRRYILLHSLELGCRQYFYDDVSSVVGLLNTDRKGKQWLYLLSLKSDKLHHNRKMKVVGDMLDDWRDTEIFQEEGRIMMRTKSYVEKKQQWVLENLSVVSDKHTYKKDWKKAIRELAKDVKAKQGMGLVTVNKKLSLSSSSDMFFKTRESENGKVLWNGSDGHTWVFVPDDGARFEPVPYGTYLLEYQHPDGRSIPIDLGLTSGAFKGFPLLCGSFLPRLAKPSDEKIWGAREALVKDLMSVLLERLKECFYAIVFDNNKKGFVYSELAEKAFEVDLETGESRVLDIDFPVSGKDARGRVEEIIVQSNRQFFIKFENAFLTGALDDKSKCRSVFGSSLRLGKNIIVSIGNCIQFHHIWNMPCYKDMAWVNGVQQEVFYPIDWQSFRLPCEGLTLLHEDKHLYAANEHHSFEFMGFTQAVNHMLNVWSEADRNTRKIPEQGWGDLNIPMDLELYFNAENEIEEGENEVFIDLSELRFISFVLGDRGHSGLRNDIINALHSCEVIERTDFPVVTEDELKAKNPCSLLLWISDYDGIVIPMAIPDSEITTDQRKALKALNGNYMESWFMSDVDEEDWLSALTLLVLTDNIGDVLEDMCEELEEEGIEVDVEALEKLKGNWMQYGINLEKPESLNRYFTSVSIVQLAS